MGSYSRGILLILVTSVSLLKDSMAGVQIEMQFLRYQDTCREDLSTSACDPKFYFCLDRPRTNTQAIAPCYYKHDGESGYFQNTNVIDMNALISIGGISNPWIIYAPTLMDQSMLFVVRVRDDDTLGPDDDLAFLSIMLTETVYLSKNQAFWTSRQMKSGDYQPSGQVAFLEFMRMTFNIRVYCEANYYSKNCSVHCMAADGPQGHYTCDPVTGSKVCMRGWTGANCVEDLDECALNYCQRGRCQNLEGDYVCYCPPDHTGKNCSTRVYPCDKNPCSNNATCINREGLNYTCNCVDDWEGDLCDVKLNPCKSSPCQNGGTCTASDDHEEYSCNCPLSSTGIHCETIMTVPTTESTTTERTMGGNYTNEPLLATASSEGFQWYYIVIPIMIILILVVVLAICCCRRKKQKEVNGREGCHPDRLAFENNAYSGFRESNVVFKENIEQSTPVVTSKGDKLSPTFINISSQDSEKEDNKDGEDCLDGHGYVKPNKTSRPRPYENMDERLRANNRALKNPYTGFISSNGTSEGNSDAEEVHYHDLDEVAESFKSLDDTVKEHKTPEISLTLDEALSSDDTASIQSENWSSVSGIYNTPKPDSADQENKEVDMPELN